MLMSDIFVLVKDKIVTFGEVQTDADYLDGIEVLSGTLLRIWLDLTFPPSEDRVDARHLSAFFS